MVRPEFRKYDIMKQVRANTGWCLLREVGLHLSLGNQAE